jgi:Flp pilus assembly pilin Flp
MKRHLSKVTRLFVRLAKDEQGGEVLEYALTLGFLALTCYVMVQMVGLKFFNFWDRINYALYLLG